MNNYNFLIVGAGFSGLTMAERLCTQIGANCLVVDKRNHIGGNAYDKYDDHGVLIHKYGPHIFHTNSKDVFEWLSLGGSEHLGLPWEFPAAVGRGERVAGNAKFFKNSQPAAIGTGLWP